MASLNQMVSAVLFNVINEDDDDDLISYVAAIYGWNTWHSCIRLIKSRGHVPWVLNYVECVVPTYKNEDFRRRFRMNPETFNTLVEQLRGVREHKSIGLEKQVLIFIKYVSSQMTLCTNLFYKLTILDMWCLNT